MKTFKKLSTVVATLLMTTAFVACDKDGDKPSSGDLFEGTTLKGEITEATSLEAKTYILSGPLEIKKGGSLTIPAGTTIKAKQGYYSYIYVEQGGKIFVNGTAQAPVRMMPEEESGGQGYWGGLVISGYAPITNGGTNKVEIDNTKVYGGTDATDNSGSITYLVLDGTGTKSSADVEHNGLTLNGVGNGTKIENIFVINGADDAIEFFGGTVNVTNLLAVDTDDDLFDFTEGYSGILRNAYGIWTKNYVSSEKDPRGIEADGNHDGNSPTGTPQSNFKVDGITIDLQVIPSDTEGYYMHDVFKIRRGATATITNALIKGQGQVKDVIDLTDSKGEGNVDTKITYTLGLSTPILGKEVNGTLNVSKVDGLKGADKSVFDWTGYKF